jgi:hypothetical protein
MGSVYPERQLNQTIWHCLLLCVHTNETTIMDNKTKTGSPDSRRINMEEDYEVEYWTTILDVTRAKLKAAVNAVGTSAAAVRKYLKK